MKSIIVFLLLTTTVFTQTEMKVLENSAFLLSSNSEEVKKIDNEGQKIVQINILSEIEDLSFASSKGLLGNNKIGKKYIIEISASENLLEVYSFGFQPLRIELSKVGIFPKPGNQWQLMIVENKSLTKARTFQEKEIDEIVDSTGSIQFKFVPENCSVQMELVEGNEIFSWKGNKFFENLKIGKYKLKISCNGYKTTEVDLNVEIGANPENIITLDKIDNESFFTSKSSIENNNETKSLINMKLIKGDIFVMGSTQHDVVDEKPMHYVKVDDFYIGVYEITQFEYKKIMGINPSYFKGDNRPVEQVSWFGAIKFCNKLSRQEGLSEYYKFKGNEVFFNLESDGYRLPYEAEWEFAASNKEIDVDDELYSGGTDLDLLAWWLENSENTSHEVGTNYPNTNGLYDMSGNVYEWCNDWYSNYISSPLDNYQINPKGPKKGYKKILRGGSWHNYASSCRVKNRSSSKPEEKYYNVGFRIARSIK